jgi:hypothetical protein
MLAVAMLLATGAPPPGAAPRPCFGDAYRTGAWVKAPTQGAPYRLTRDPRTNPFIKGWAFAGRRFWGACDEGFPSNHTRRTVQNYWQPEACDLQRVAADELCARLVSRRRKRPLRILFIGDSFTGQAFTSFVAQMGGFVLRNEGSKRTAATGSMAFQDIPTAELRTDALACIDKATELSWDYVSDTPGKGMSAPLRISFVRNEHMGLNTEEPKTQYRHEYPFAHLITHETIVVTQVLAWFHTDGPGFERSYQDFLGMLQGKLSQWGGAGASRRHAVTTHKQQPHSAGRPLASAAAAAAVPAARQLVLLSASHGHLPPCQVETSRGRVSARKGPKPGQHDYATLNRIGENLTRAAGATYLDITTMLRSRSDGHMPHDCGHWCLPGPYDIGGTLLFNALIGHIRGLPIGRLRTDQDLRGVRLDSTAKVESLLEKRDVDAIGTVVT